MRIERETTSSRTYLIVNADDYGQSQGINDGIARAHREGIVTSASLMVRWPSSMDAARYAHENSDLSLGLHVDLGEWIYRDAEWVSLYTVVDPDNVEEVQRELKAQLEMFRDLAGVEPTHIDSHQHVHRSATLLPLFQAIAAETGAVLRHATERVRYDGRFYAWDRHGESIPGAISVAALVAIIDSLPTGITELGCHPGLGDDTISPYRVERSIETQTLCHAAVREAITRRGAQLVSFHDVARGDT